MATLPELEAALRKADAAGNADDARALANAIRQMRGTQPAAEKPSFAGVRGSVSGETPLGMGAIPKSLEQINAENRASYDPAAMQRTQLANTHDAYAKMPTALRFAAGAGEPVDRLIRGIGQLGTPDQPKTLSDLIAHTPSQAEAREQQARAIADATVNSDTAGQVGRFTGDVALLAAPGSKVTGLRNTMMVGGLYGGLQPVADGESRLANVATSALLTGAGQKGSDLLLASGKRAAAAISPEVRKLYEAAKARGIDLTPAQLSDSKAIKFAQSMLSRLPLIGSGGRNEAQIAAWNRELAKAIGEDAPVVTPEVYAAAKSRQSAQFNDLTARNSIHEDMIPGLVRKLEAIRQEAGMAGDDAQKAVSNALNSFYARLSSGGVEGGAADGTVSSSLGGLPGRAYQALDSQLGQVTKLGTPASHFVGQIRSALRDAMDNSVSPQDKAAWDALRVRYGNRKTVRDIVSQDGSPISPASLMSRVRSNNAGKEAMASGKRGEIGELAQIGQRLKEPPSSGTAERLGSMAVGAGAIANLPLTLAALVGGSAVKKGLDSSALARLILRESRGQTRQALAPLVRGTGAAAVPIVQGKRTEKSGKR